ncbi:MULTISPECIES: mechanosensitive ion channel family protein [Haloarcula]|uniref:mechanosensitive ion channel family protein n=1 Tax=Haloarcula TaxID=2237 RepID=UPI0023EDBFCC|nr:mechanosensitive ion channel family protein [Halomicroarcula sp. XH51]
MQQSAVARVTQQALDLVERLTTTEGRFAVSVGLLLLTALLALLVLPFVVRQINRIIASRYMTGHVADTADAVGKYVPTSFSSLLLRITQLSVLVVASLGLLVVWGLFEWAVTLGDFFVSAVPDLLKGGLTLFLVVLGFAVSEQLKTTVDRLGDGSNRITQHQEEIILRVGQVAIVVTVVASALTLWGVNLSGLLVGAGFLGIVVGMAARQTLGAGIAGFVLMFSRPFTIGDWVQIGESEGIVTDITIFNTRVENFDGEFVVIPNDRVADQAITNRSQKGLLRLTLDVGVDYDTDIEWAEEVAHEAMVDVDHVVDSPPPQVVPKQFGDSAIVMELRFWIDHPTPPRKWRAVSSVVREIKTCFDGEGITIPFPQRTLSGRDDGLDARIATGEERVVADGDGD